MLVWVLRKGGTEVPRLTRRSPSVCGGWARADAGRVDAGASGGEGARAGGVEHDGVDRAVGGDAAEGDSAHADGRADDVQRGAGGAADRVVIRTGRDVHRPAARRIESGAGGR